MPYPTAPPAGSPASPSPSTHEPAHTPPAGDGAPIPVTGGMARIWDGIQVAAAIGSPIAVGTALLFYFGWSRSQAQAQAFGTDISVFEMSPDDLALRSLDALYFPSLFLLLAALIGVRLHRALLRRSTPRVPPPPRRPPPAWLRRIDRTGLTSRFRLPQWIRADSPTWTLRIIRLLRRSWLVLLPAAGVLLATTDHIGHLTLPFWIGLAMLGPVYATVLRRHITGDHTRTPLPVMAVTTALFVVMLFWQTERLAVLIGDATAQDIKTNPAVRLHPTTLYSAKKLYLTAPGVTETALPAPPEDAYHYRYDGLYLLQHSADKYFLISNGWTTQHGRLFIVPDSESVRLEFTG